MALENPDIWDASYQHPAYYHRSAVRLVVYLWRRPDDKQDASSGSGWSTVPPQRRLGDAGVFVRSADARTRAIREDARSRGKDLTRNKAAWACSFVHLILSPSNRAELPDEDLKRLAEPWVRDAKGRIMPHVGAVHREGGGHLHLAIVRDKFGRDELEVLKEHASALAMRLGLGMERGMRREMEQEEGLGLTMEKKGRLFRGLEL